MKRVYGMRLLVESKRPGIARTDRRRSGSFASLLDQILQDERALDGLVFAYSVLPETDRLALAHAVVQDAKEPAQALLALLSVEEHPPLRDRLAALLVEHSAIERSAFVREDRGRGEAVLVQSVADREPEALRVSWDGQEIEVIAVEARKNLCLDGLARADVSETVGLLAPLLWRRIRSGKMLPLEIRRFAGFFSLR